nr:hypothetical protein [uncultured Flavobacterium sp.]
MPFDTTTYSSPFWAKSADFIRGRDPLGIQNSSISVYSILLPGMTNLTLRLRYYGFYLWLLDEYHQLPSESIFKQNVRGQYNFIRRAELILSYFMVNKFPAEQSVVGSNFAIKYINDLEKQSYYNIALGADKLPETIKNAVYWDYISGAFGQYYVGTLMALQLIDAKTEGYFERTEKGKKLANAYRDSIKNNESMTLFLNRIKEGKLYAKDLEHLLDFALNKEITNSSEEAFYLDMLLDFDGEKFKNTKGVLSDQRKETILLFLNYLAVNDDKNAWKDFPLTIYNVFLENSTENNNDAALGWYYYYLNELVHFSIETIFWGILLKMEREQQTIADFIENSTTSILQHIKDNFKDIDNLTLAEVLDLVVNLEASSSEYIEFINEDLKEKNDVAGMCDGILLLLKLYNESIGNVSKIEQYATDFALFDKNGNALSIFKNFIDLNKELKFPEFISTIIKTILNDHTAIAYRKMGSGEKNLLKFILEDNYLIHIETMTPNFTSPRIKTLYNFLIDLGLISKDGILSDKANDLIPEEV